MFQVEGRIGRGEYLSALIRTLLITLLLGVVDFIIIVIAVLAGGLVGDSVVIIGQLFIIAALVWLVFRQWQSTARRFHDFNVSRIWATAILIPFVNLAVLVLCLLKPSTDGRNRFGPPARYGVASEVGAVTPFVEQRVIHNYPPRSE